MASASFTRDEVILALDVFYSSPKGRVTADSDEIKELSLLLNRLPIHPVENRRADFRSPAGITTQLIRFRSSCISGKKGQNVGELFFHVAFEYETSVYKGYKQDKIEMRGDRAEMSDFPLYLNTVAGGLDRRDQTIGGFSFVVKIYAVPVVEIIG